MFFATWQGPRTLGSERITSMPVYKPTFLYIKQHELTGLLYFGKTINKNPEKYLGSGLHWTRHLKIHGKEHVKTLWYCLFLNQEEITKFALNFSNQENIVESKDWANLKNENGMDGVIPGTKFSIETRNKISKISSNRSADTKFKMSKSGKLKRLSDKTKAKLSEIGKNISDETRAKMSKSHIGKLISLETRAKIANTTKGRLFPKDHKAKISWTIAKKRLIRLALRHFLS